MKKKFDQLYEKSKTGKIKYWNIVVDGTADGPATIIVKYGVDGEKERITSKEITVGKNIGKANETTPWEQACSEAESTWKKKLDEGYVTKIGDVEAQVLLPMLAHRFQDRKRDIKYPAFVQPKLDGIRCFAIKKNDTTIEYISRQGKPLYTLAHLTADLLKIMYVGEILDGEVYSHDYTFQEMISFVKKERPESQNLEFWVFDKADPNFHFHVRYLDVKASCLLLPKNSKVRLVKTESVTSEAEVYQKHNEYVKDGYEGVIVRNKASYYTFKNRSKDLQKYKTFEDSEFEIVSGYPGTGTEEGAITFVCVTDTGKEFGCRPRGSFEQRREWMNNLSDLIGKKLTVRYQELTDDGVPRFPVGIAIRTYE